MLLDHLTHPSFGKFNNDVGGIFCILICMGQDYFLIPYWKTSNVIKTDDCTIKPHFECVVCTCKENISDHISQAWLLQQKGDSQTGRLEFLLSLSKLAQHFCCWWLGYNCGLKGSYFMESWCFYIQVNLAIKYIESWFRPINPFDFKSWVASS